MITAIIEASVSFGRLYKFLLNEELDPEAVKQFEKDQQRTRPALNGSIITCMKVAIMYCTSTSRRDIIFTLGRVRCSFRSRKICDALGKF